MRILLTGGAGYIGSNTAVELLNSGYEIIIADNFSNSNPGVPGKIAKLTKKLVHVSQTDITNREELRRLFRAYQIDAIVHFATFKSVGESVSRPLEYYRNNLDGLLTVLEVMREFQVKTIIYSSSATVYGSENATPAFEDMATGTCTNPYGRIKLMSEQILKDTAQADPELSVLLLRYFNAVGGHASGLLGEHPTGEPNSLMAHIVQAAEGKQEKLHVFGGDYPTPDGTGIRDYIHVTDLAQGHVAALAYGLTHQGVEAINLGTGRGISVLEMVKAFERVTGAAVPYQILNRRIGDVAACWATVDKARRMLGWTAQKSLEDMCRDSWNSRA